ncbi:hypothetical protein BHM03_00043316 [Ensete ventricosum]|nr:hypothetical protein BHM03_00043316 [Ensete ventricosum]
MPPGPCNTAPCLSSDGIRGCIAPYLSGGRRYGGRMVDLSRIHRVELAHGMLDWLYHCDRARGRRDGGRMVDLSRIHRVELAHGMLDMAWYKIPHGMLDWLYRNDMRAPLE